MRLFLPILAIVLVSCQAMPDMGESSRGEIYTKSGQLVNMLEKFRRIMRHGDPQKDIPILDPLKLEHLDVDVAQTGLVKATGAVDDLEAIGLSDYKITRGDFTLVGLKVNLGLEWEQINLKTKYMLDGSLLDEIAFNGDGAADVIIKGLNLTVDLKLNVQDKKLHATDLEVHAHIKQLNVEITGLYDDEDMSKLVSQIITDVVPGLIEDYQTQFSQQISPVVTNMLNNILKDLTLKDLLDMING